MRLLRQFLPFVQPEQDEAAAMQTVVPTSGRMFKLVKTVLLVMTVISLAFAPLLSTFDGSAYILANVFGCFHVCFAIVVFCVTSNGFRLSSTVITLSYSILLLICALLSHKCLASATDLDEGVFFSSIMTYAIVNISVLFGYSVQEKREKLRLDGERPVLLQLQQVLQVLQDKPQPSRIQQLLHKISGFLFERQAKKPQVEEDRKY
ncbi:hypothetical protein PFISCL1PPCAC_21646 [Pristionchus fissidentatus]|uniref:Uncharacterized protein n=1 Tax=Pristionchus fissidentatus TaxID=1538716 RepID=A0AAV5WE91_9BILA|nr:hypothetical protein PFISCL1PPCAC_21646 [Pristionchus fissidentatus]